MDALITKLIDKVDITSMGDICLLVAMYALFIHLRLMYHIHKARKGEV